MTVKFKFPKIKLIAALWAVLAVAVAVELLVLYQALFPAGDGGAAVAAEPAAQEIIRIDRAALTKFQDWLSTRENYILRQEPFRQGGLGRENPFAEY